MRLGRRPLALGMLVVILAATGIVGLTARAAGAAVTVEVSPDQQLRDGQTVHVKASGLPAKHSPIQVVQCVCGTVDSLRCDGNTLDISADTDARGNYDNPNFVVHTLAQRNHDSIDCDVSHPCEIYVGVDYNNAFKVDSGAAPISFGRAAVGLKATSSRRGNSVPLLPMAAAVVVILLGLALFMRGRTSRRTGQARSH